MVNIIKSILQQLNIQADRIIIDLKKEMIESENEYNATDLLELCGTLPKEREFELLEAARKAREDWD